jgi:hypothetical protein
MISEQTTPDQSALTLEAQKRLHRDHSTKLSSFESDAAGGVGDCLWFMSSEFFLMLPQLLARHRRQVILLVVRDVAFPHAHFGHRDHSDRSIVISKIGGS